MNWGPIGLPTRQLKAAEAAWSTTRASSQRENVASEGTSNANVSEGLAPRFKATIAKSASAQAGDEIMVTAANTSPLVASLAISRASASGGRCAMVAPTKTT